MNPRSSFVLPALLLAALGCRDNASSPMEPEPVTPQPLVSAAALTFLQVSAGGYHACGVTMDNRAYCWGYNVEGQLGSGTNTGPELCNGAVGPFPCSTRPVLVAGAHRFRQISAGFFHTCGVTTDNRAFCWGINRGALGDGTADERDAPVPVAGGLQFRQVDAGNSHSCGVTTDNRAFCWGDNTYGQLGDRTTTSRLTPVAVKGGLTFKQVTAGIGNYSYTCGVTTDSRAFCWGKNNLGQLGDSSAAARRITPSLVAGGHRFRQVDAGYDHACGVTTANRAFCWGNGRQGQLGNGKTYLSFWPRAVGSGLSFERVTAGDTQTCGETTTNRGYCWGLNAFGEVGDGSGTRSLKPGAVAGGLYFAQLNAGSLFTCGRTPDAVGYCWGYGFFGQLGNGTSSFGAEAATPVPVAGPR